MAGGGGIPTSGGRKSLDAEINLVPFIDLLSMCICFLLMTAIWIEIGSLEMRQILGTEASAVTNEAIDIQIRFRPDKNFDFVIEKGGQAIQTDTIQAATMDLKLAMLGQRVSNLMAAVSTDPNGAPNITGRIIPNSSVNYSELVAVLDTLKSYGISSLGVVPVKE